MGTLKKIALLMVAAIGLLILVYIIWRSFAAFTSDYSWKEMDWDQDGSTSFSEFVESSDIGKRIVEVNGENCIEYFSFKDGLTVRNSCSVE